MQCCRFFFCKQKTAYEMRFSDWSSDVCSSDLGRPRIRPEPDLCCRWCTHFVKYVTLRGLTLSNLGNARQAFVRLVGDVRMRRARGSAFLSEINPTAGPSATGRREQLRQGPGKDRNAQPVTERKRERLHLS